MYTRILAYFQRKFKPGHATIEAVCYSLDLSLEHGFQALDWEGW